GDRGRLHRGARPAVQPDGRARPRRAADHRRGRRHRQCRLSRDRQARARPADRHREIAMSELRRILEAVESSRKRGVSAALATVVRISGSAYRRPGARLLVTERGESVGSVSGGCLEQDVRRVASLVLRTGKPRLLCYDGSSEQDQVWGYGQGCPGVVEILVEPATFGIGAGYLRFLRDILGLRETAAV